MMWRIGGLIFTIVLVILSIGMYLSPDDLAGCGRPESTGSCRAADAIVVISGGDTDARTDGAIELYRRGWAPLIIVSGAAADKSGISNAEAMRQRAIARGVPDEAIISEPDSETTKQNALEVTSIIEQKDISRVILVTSGYHMRRASLEFGSNLGSGVELARHPSASDRQWGALWWMTPWGWWTAASELVKIGAFYVGGTR